MSIKEKENALVEDFELFDDWADRYEHLISLGKSLPLIDPKYKTDDYLVRGCQSKVWLNAEMKDDKVVYKADSDAIITKGIVAMLVEVMSNETPDEILNTQLEFIDKVGLKEHLSPNRSNGLVSMIKEMKSYALGFKALQNSSK
ncbi:MAG TPA: SufE family protein [Chitinophagales bacterium]|nr:SufE family protein [Chitinophagales bacterium]